MSALFVLGRIMYVWCSWMHAFWTVPDPQAAAMEQTQFMKDLALAGAALMFQRIERWPASIKA